MYSCEQSRTKAYNEDLRWRMVWQRKAMGKSIQEIAKNLCVDQTTVYRILRIFHLSGSVDKKSYPKERSFRKLTKPAQLLIMQLVIERPGKSLCVCMVAD